MDSLSIGTRTRHKMGLRRSARGVKRRLTASNWPIAGSVRDFQRKFSCVLDPARDELFRRKETDKFSFLIGVGHRLREIRGVAVLELIDCVDPDFAQESCV